MYPLAEAASHKPLLTGTTAARAEEVITQIARALVEVGPLVDDTLASGNLGIALFLAYESAWSGRPDRSGPFLQHASDAMAVQALDASLFEGVSGTAWVFRHLERGSDELTDFDEVFAVLQEHCGRSADPVTDLISGLVGIGVACLEHLPDNGPRACLEVIMRRLYERTRDASGVSSWLALAKPLVFPPSPDLGMAHGVPGLIALAARALRAGVLPDVSHRLLEQAVDWLLEQRESAGHRFPYCAGGQAFARDGWCYGDPGVALTLLAAGRATGKQAWCAAAHQQALWAARRAPELTGVEDASFCHGAAGLAHMFQRFYRVTGDLELRTAAVAWMVRTLGFQRATAQGVSGYSTIRGLVGGGKSHVIDYGALTGVAGIGLCLLSGVSGRELSWDRVFLTDVLEP